MNDEEDKGELLERALAKSSEAEEVVEFAAETGPVSPLGWTIRGRLICAAAAAAFLWLAVAWAVGWLD